MSKLSVTYPEPPSPRGKRARNGEPGLFRSIVNWLCIAALAVIPFLLLQRHG